MAKNDAVVLLSGGLDSATVLAMANHDGRRCHALSFVYGQRHAAETERARSVARALGVASFRVATLDLRVYGGSALTSDDYAVPKDNAQPGDGPVPITYVPARNTIFLSHALALAEVLGAEEIWIGVNAVDYSGYPDCRPEFVEAFERLANVATAAGVEGGTRFRIRAPLMRMSKAEIIRQGTALGVDYGMTLSCYDPEPGEKACGRCDACRLRAKGFAEAKLPDPTRYVED